MIEAEFGSMTGLAGMGVFQTELGANQVPLKLAPLPVLTVTVADCAALPPGPVQVSVKLVAALTAPVLALPVVGSLPDQPPGAVQPAAFVEDQARVEADPLTTVLGVAVRLTCGAFTPAGPVVGDTALAPPQPLTSPANAEDSRAPKRRPAR